MNIHRNDPSEEMLEYCERHNIKYNFLMKRTGWCFETDNGNGYTMSFSQIETLAKSEAAEQSAHWRKPFDSNLESNAD